MENKPSIKMINLEKVISERQLKIVEELISTSQTEARKDLLTNLKNAIVSEIPSNKPLIESLIKFTDYIAWGDFDIDGLVLGEIISDKECSFILNSGEIFGLNLNDFGDIVRYKFDKDFSKVVVNYVELLVDEMSHNSKDQKY